MNLRRSVAMFCAMVVVGGCSGASAADIGAAAGGSNGPQGSTSAAGADGGTGATVRDAGLRQDAAGVGSDAGAGHAADSSAPEAGVPDSPSDPCPLKSGLPVALDCDPACHAGPVNALCSQVTCDKGLHASLAVPSLVRTPEAPGTDPQCAAQCPNGGFAYGMGFQVSTGPTQYVVRVNPPWKIIVASQQPFCVDSHAYPASGCRGLPYRYDGYVYVVTDDPNAPARNVSIDVATASNVCPS